MFGRLRSSLRHPFYPGLRVTRARAAKVRHTVLAGSFQELADAATRGVQVTHAIFLLRDESSPPDEEARRDALWRWFQVPSFVLVVDSQGRPKAYECEAREGLHVPSPPASGEYDTRLCPCGRPGPRLKVPAPTECAHEAAQPVPQST
jgi:hypothetical protein